MTSRLQKERSKKASKAAAEARIKKKKSNANITSEGKIENDENKLVNKHKSGKNLIVSSTKLLTFSGTKVIKCSEKQYKSLVYASYIKRQKNQKRKENIQKRVAAAVKVCKNLRKRVQIEKENTLNDVSQEINENEIMGHEIDINDREKKEEYDESDADDVIEEEVELKNYDYDIKPYPRPSSSIAGTSNVIMLPDRASSCPPKKSPLNNRRKKNYFDISERNIKQFERMIEKLRMQAYQEDKEEKKRCASCPPNQH